MNIIGHSRAIKVLKRLADERRLAHGYLFFGPKGVGKRLVAESLAHYCEGGTFVPATRILNDARVVTPDAEGSIGIDAVRALKFFLYERPNVSFYRLAIIDGAERLTLQAQNALLKLAEEPPSSGVLVLIASDWEALLPTLQSRLHQVFFSLVPGAPLDAWLQKEHGCSAEKAKAVRSASFGAPARALELLAPSGKKGKDDAARRFLSAPASQRRELVKALIAPVDFSLPEFLDSCIALLAEESAAGKTNRPLWHKILALRREAAHGTLNARLQLNALLE